ncbi:integral membrane protein [Aspergillus heteromorphus CBS 117.55]|uniref:Integral membrane protein n=1 Tax=Aspergillus heteromorphus CBS 117.55 TaxID=1448321 RepID=A0A317VHR6_9EURO|nr:uncharacterized protein BO70DRAFT_364982 [Aspergillus heteromorphus CBS 117.55]PWY72432.1 integral membrane protein [Aspergillus heteromorphus CBS 117.55]
MITTSTFGSGVVGPYTGHSLALRITIATLAAISCYNAVELVILVFVTFAQFRGPYFWSLLLSALGIIPYSIGFLLKYFNLTDAPALALALITVGWYLMVTGQSVVLYSRLHLVLPNPRILRRVRTMIIVDACLLHLPTTVLTFGSNLAANNAVYIAGYNVMEKIQMTAFCLQEFILSALYIWETIRMLRLDPDRGKRKIMYQLVAINLVIIALDLGLLVIEYRDLYILETMIKGVIYSVKLKLEFAVLGKLVLLVRGGHIWKPEAAAIYRSHRRPDDFPDFVDATRVTSDLTHAAAPRPRSHPWMDSEDVSIAIFEHADPDAAESSRDPDPRQRTGHSDASHSWSGETQTNNSAYADVERELSPLDFTDSIGKQKSDLLPA